LRVHRIANVHQCPPCEGVPRRLADINSAAQIET
jgi:hypothetical protein